MFPTSVFGNSSESGFPSSTPNTGNSGPTQGNKRKTGQNRRNQQKNNENKDFSSDESKSNNRSRNGNQRKKKLMPLSAPTESGFKPRQYESRPIPSYLISSSRSVHHQDREPDSWDLQNQQAMLDVERVTPDLQTLYEKLQQMRETERVEMENRGYVDKENTKKTLDKAISFIGSCPDMCPTFERIRRTYENNVKQLEKDPNTGKTTREYAIKAFSRPAAGQPPSLPSDVRPPAVLRRTLYYIIDNVIPKLPNSHSFLWDRTRSIRQDFTYQNYSGPEAIECNELIVRTHILSLHIMAGSDADYSQQQELEQMNKALQTLTEFYADCRKHGINDPSPREAEMRAYQLISHLRDSDMEQQIQRQLPAEKWKDPVMQYALRFRTLLQQNNVVERGFVNTENAPNLFADFFYAIKHDKNVPILLACLTECHFNSIRINALKAMAKSYHSRGKPFPISQLTEMLGFNDDNEATDFCTHYELVVHNDHDGIPCVNFASLSADKIASAAPRNQAYCKVTDDRIRSEKSLGDIIIKDSQEIGPDTVSSYNAPIIGTPRQSPLIRANEKTIFSLNSTDTLPIETKTKIQPVPSGNEPKLFGAPASQPSLFSKTTTDQKPLFTAPKSLFSGMESQSNKKVESLFDKPSGTKSTTTSLFSNITATDSSRKDTEKKESSLAITAKVPEPSKYAENDCIKARDEMVKDVVGKDLQRMLSSAWKVIEKRRNMRNQIIDITSDAIFTDIYEKVCQTAVSESLADQMDAYYLKKRVLYMIKDSLLNVLIRQREREERHREFSVMTEELAGLHSNPDESFHRRKKRRNITPQLDLRRKLPLSDKDQYSFVEEARAHLAEVWRPIHWRKKILPALQQGFAKSRRFDRDLSIAIYSDNWNGDTSLSAWIQAKFGLSSSTDSHKMRSPDGIQLTIEKLYNDPTSFQRIALLILVISNDFTREQCIEMIITISQAVVRNSIFKVDIMLMSWGTDTDEIYQIGTEAYNNGMPEQVGRLILCSMPDPPIRDNLQEALDQWALKFEPLVSDYGRKQDEEVKRAREIEANRREEEEKQELKERRDIALKEAANRLSPVRSLNQFTTSLITKPTKLFQIPQPKILKIPNSIVQLNELVAQVRKQRSETTKSDNLKT